VVGCAWAIEHAHALGAATTGPGKGLGALAMFAIWALAVGFGGAAPRLL